MSQMPIDRWMRGLALFGVLLCFGVVVLGAYVRLTDAGLGCPDWPGCYGHVSPVGAERSPASQAHGVTMTGTTSRNAAWSTSGA